MSSAVLIVSPHSHCNPNMSLRHCDRVAKSVSTELYKKINSTKRIISAADYGIYRFENESDAPYTDLNRKPARTNEAGRQFRSDIINQLIEWENNPDIDKIYVFEIHSFPSDGFHGDEPVYLLYTKGQNPEEFSQLLSENVGIRPNFYESSIMTDIQQDILEHNFSKIRHSFLIEFNENEDTNNIKNGILPQDVRKKLISNMVSIVGGGSKKKYLLGGLFILTILLILFLIWRGHLRLHSRELQKVIRHFRGLSNKLKYLSPTL